MTVNSTLLASKDFNFVLQRPRCQRAGLSTSSKIEPRTNTNKHKWKRLATEYLLTKHLFIVRAWCPHSCPLVFARGLPLFLKSIEHLGHKEHRLARRQSSPGLHLYALCRAACPLIIIQRGKWLRLETVLVRVLTHNAGGKEARNAFDLLSSDDAGIFHFPKIVADFRFPRP